MSLRSTAIPAGYRGPSQRVLDVHPGRPDTDASHSRLMGVTMNKVLAAAGACAVALGVGLLGGVPASAAPHGIAATIPVHFSFEAGETPENAVPEPDGGFDVSFSVAREIARVGLDGRR